MLTVELMSSDRALTMKFFCCCEAPPQLTSLSSSASIADTTSASLFASSPLERPTEEDMPGAANCITVISSFKSFFKPWKLATVELPLKMRAVIVKRPCSC